MSLRELFGQYFWCKNLIYFVQAILPLPFLDVSGKGRRQLDEPNALIEPLVLKAERLDIDQTRFKKALKEQIDALAAGKAPAEDLENLLLTHYRELEDEIHQVSKGLEKARAALLALVDIEAYTETDQVYEVMVTLDDRLRPEAIAKVVRRWKQAASGKREREGDRWSAGDDIWWISLDNRESIDAVSRYRFRDHFGIGEFESVFTQVEYLLTLCLLEGSSGSGAREWGDYRLASVVRDLWLIGRSRTLTRRLRDYVDVALGRISDWQSPEGWWTANRVESVGEDPETGQQLVRQLPSTRMTAYCSLNLLKLATSDSRRQQGVDGARWLLERQRADGSWATERRSARGLVLEPDLLVTLLALEATARSNIQNTEYALKLGIEWILDQQDDLGMWPDGHLPFPFMTIVVLEFLESVEHFPGELVPYLSASKGFLDRSVLLSLEDNNNSHRLTIVSAFQGIEAFLYAVLSHPSVNIKVFQRPDRTIGMRSALRRFQTHLQEGDRLERNEVIPFRNSLDRLAYVRDQVVHKAIDVTGSECRPLVTDALKFARRYSIEVFGYDPWL